MSTTTTAIEWTDRTWNPLRGCSAVSEGCTNCYAATLANRWNGEGQPYEGLTRRSGGRAVWTGKVQLVPEKLTEPLSWRKPARVFVNSMSDLFHADVPDAFIARVFAVMALTPQHTYQVLTKRPERMAGLLTLKGMHWDSFTASIQEAMTALCCGVHDYPDWPLPNVWLGTSVENQAAADERIPHLLRTPAAVRFLSAEPLLGPVDLVDQLPGDALVRAVAHHKRTGHECGGAAGGEADCDGCSWRTWSIGSIDWVIAGGESGPHARPCHPDWARSLRDQCVAAGVPFFFKQWGEWLPLRDDSCDPPRQTIGLPLFRDWPRRDLDGVEMIKPGKKVAGRLLDGRTWDEFPAVSL